MLSVTVFLFAFLFINGCLSLNCECGQRQTPKENEVRQSGRFKSKYEAHVNEFPWVAFIKIGHNGNFCGGTLVNNKYVITAAHCVEERNLRPTSITVTLGEHNRNNKWESDSFKAVATRFYIYQGYKRYGDQSLENDIAIIELAKAVNFYSYPHIRPICLPEAGATYSSNSLGSVAGWGATHTKICSSQGICKVDRNSFSDVLIKLDDVELISQEKCNQDYSKHFSITKGSICGLSKSGDSCNGDSGSGLIYTNQKTGQHELVGIVSYGAGCNSTLNGKKLPGVYADIRSSEILNWIQNTISRMGQFCDASPGITVHSQGPRDTGSWGPWSSFSKCTGKPYESIGKKRRERKCSHPKGKGCGRGNGRLFENQERPCYL